MNLSVNCLLGANSMTRSAALDLSPHLFRQLLSAGSLAKPWAEPIITYSGPTLVSGFNRLNGHIQLLPLCSFFPTASLSPWEEEVSVLWSPFLYVPTANATD